MKAKRIAWPSITLLLFLALLAACGPSRDSDEAAISGSGAGEERQATDVLTLPELAPVAGSAERPLGVVATTSIIGDVVAQVGGERIALTTLMGPGQDPHSYEPSTADLTRVAEADVIFINGWDLEEGLVDDLANIAGDTPLAPISAGIEPLYFGGGGGEVEDEHSVDPHVWMDPQNVRRWVRNVSQVLGSLDTENAGYYADNAAAYEEELVALQGEMAEELAKIPEEKRKLVTNHDALAYFARRFDFQIVGTVIPAASTMAEPSAQEMVSLVEKMRAEGVCAVFTESTANARLAETVAAELEDCEEVKVLALYTGALGSPGSGATNYVEMMRVDVEAIGYLR